VTEKQRARSRTSTSRVDRNETRALAKRRKASTPGARVVQRLHADLGGRPQRAAHLVGDGLGVALAVRVERVEHHRVLGAQRDLLRRRDGHARLGEDARDVLEDARAVDAVRFDDVLWDLGVDFT